MSGAAPISDTRMREANRRLALVETYRGLKSQGFTPNEAVGRMRRMGIAESRATLDRYDKAHLVQGYAGLLPNSHLSGRRSELDRLKEKLGKDVVESLLARAAATALDTQSEVMGLRLVAQSPEAPESFAQLVDYAAHGGPRASKHALPPSIRQAIRRNPAVVRRHSGQRNSNLRGFWIPRRVDILPGDVWTSDDTTPIWGWWVPWEHAKGNPAFDKASCEYRHGVKLLQGQLLPLADVASNCVFQVALIARETSAYRASDIWSLFGRAFAQFGLPRLGFQLERGSWESNLIRGVEVSVEQDGVSLDRRVGGLRMLPTNVTAWHRQTLGGDFTFPSHLQTWTSYLPKSKPVEAIFDRMQTLEGTLWGNLGRDQQRRPNEAAKKQFEACRRGAADPRLHFLSGTELLTRLRALIEFLNNEPMEGQVFKGVPRLLWEQNLREHPLYRMPEEQQYLFRRSWHATRITRGWVICRFTDAEGTKRVEHYCQPERFPDLEGREVLAYFDTEDCRQPAQIHDAATGEYLCGANWFERPGMFLDAAQQGHDLKRRYNNALTTLYADTASKAPSRQLPQEIAERRNQPAEVVTFTPQRERAPKADNPMRPASQDQFQRDQARRLKLAEALRKTGLEGVPVSET